MEVAADLTASGDQTCETTGACDDVADPLVYQLVRVEGDGTLIPATEDDVVQFEHFLDAKSSLPTIEDVAQVEQLFSDEMLLLKKFGPDESNDSKLELHKLDASDETAELPEFMGCCLLEKPNCIVLPDNIPAEIVSTVTSDSSSKFQSDSTSVETGPHSMIVDDSISAEKECADGNSLNANEALNRSADEHKGSALPDIAFKGEICLDKLTIRELQEAFRVVFGRSTTVKDKIWLKKRIAMGLTNSSEVPTSGFIMKDSMLLRSRSEGKEKMPSTSKSETSSPQEQVSDSGSTGYKEFPKRSCRDKDQQASRKRLNGVIAEHGSLEGNIEEDQCIVKRMRKPTKRYIEELSDSSIRESTSRYSVAGKSGHESTSYSSQISPGHVINPWNMPFTSRQVTLGGSNAQIPFVSRMRRTRPRKNLLVVQEHGRNGEGRKTIEMDNSVLVHEMSEQTDEALENTLSNTAYQPSFRRKDGFKRKHHRAWTLCEVLKLIDGVARFGAGKWSEIRKLAFASYSYRTSVDLKDKWRNLIRASIAQLPPDNGNGAPPKKPVSPMPLPPSVLLRVRELAEMQSAQTGNRVGMNRQLAEQRPGAETAKGSGFL